MGLQSFKSDYLRSKDLSYFQDYNEQQKSSGHIYVAENLDELQETLQELNLPQAMFYYSTTDSF